MKGKIKEQIEYGDYPERMDPRTERKLGDPEQNLYGASPAMPRGSQDVQRIASERFKSVVDKLREAIGQPNLTSDYAKRLITQEFANSVRSAIAIESRFKDRLEELAILAALKATESERDKYDIDAQITGSPGQISSENFKFQPKQRQQQPQAQQQQPPEEEFNPENLTPDEKFELEVHKRHIINGIIQGASKKGHYIFQDPEIREELDQMDGRLYGYYLKLMAINDYFYFVMEDLIEGMSQTGRGIEGREDITSHNAQEEGDDEGDEQGGEEQQTGKFKITARGLLFPILCHEIIKGIEETLGKFGYPEDDETAKEVLGQTETLPNEAMSLRIGPQLVEYIRKSLPDQMFDEENFGIKPFFYMLLYRIPAKDFLKLIANVVSRDREDNARATTRFRQIFEQAKASKQRYEQKRAQGQNPELEPMAPPEPERPARAPEVQEPKSEITDKKLSEMGLNALNYELNQAIDSQNWELASRIQRMIERKQG